MSQESFDLNAWRKSGEQAYAQLEQEEKSLVERLAELRHQKEELAVGLGMSAPKQKRVRIRPAIVTVLEQNGPGVLEFSDLFARVRDVIPEVREESLKVSLTRLAAEETKYKVSGTEITISKK